MAIVEIGALRALLAMDAGEFVKGSKRTQTELSSLERSLESIQKVANTVGKNMSMYVTAPLLALGTTSIGAARDFEKSMTNVSTLVDTAKESMADMSHAVTDMGKRVPVALTDLSGALYDVRSAGVSADDAMNVLEQSARLGVAGLGTTAEAADLVTSSLNAFGLKGEEAARVYDNIFKTVAYGKTTITQLSQGFGAVAGTMAASKIKLDEYLASVAALTTTGLPAAQAHTQLRAAIVGLSRETEIAKKVFQAYGVKTFEELMVKAGGLVNALKLIKGSLGDNKDAMLKLVGSAEAVNAIIGLTGNQNEAFVKTLTDMRLGSNAVDEAFRKQNETTAAVQQRFANAVNEMGIAIGTALNPAVESLTNWITNLVNSFNSLSPQMQTTIVLMGSAVAAIGPLMLIMSQFAGLIRTLVIPALGLLGTAFSALYAATGPIGVFIAAATLAYTAWQNFSTQITALINGVVSMFKAAFDALVASVMWLLEKLGLVSEKFTQSLEPALDATTASASLTAAQLAATGATLDQTVTPAVDRAALAFQTLAATMEAMAGSTVNLQPGKVKKPGSEGDKQADGNLTGAAYELAKSMAGLNTVMQPVAVNLDNHAAKHTAAASAAKEHNNAIQEGKQIMQELLTPMEELRQKQEHINEVFRKGGLTVEQYGRAMAAATAMNSKNMDALASTVSSNLSTIFGDTKAVAIATALINTYQGITRALATYPPPISYAMAAVQAAAGFAQVANIRKQTSSGGGGSASSSSAGVSSAAAVPQQTQTLEVHGISPNSLFTGNTVRAFAEKLRDFQADGGKVVFA